MLQDICGKSQASVGCVFWEWLKSEVIIESEYKNRLAGGMDWKRQTSVRGFVVQQAGIEGKGKEINPRDVEKVIMESRQKRK